MGYRRVPCTACGFDFVTEVAGQTRCDGCTEHERDEAPGATQQSWLPPRDTFDPPPKRLRE